MDNELTEETQKTSLTKWLLWGLLPAIIVSFLGLPIALGLADNTTQGEYIGIYIWAFMGAFVGIPFYMMWVVYKFKSAKQPPLHFGLLFTIWFSLSFINYALILGGCIFTDIRLGG